MTTAAVVPGAGAYDEAFASRRKAQGGEPKGLEEARRAAMERFRQHGVPTTRLEAWRKTNLAALAKTSHDLRPVPDESTLDAAQAVVDAVRLPGETARFVFVDGHPAPTLSQPGEVDGLALRPITAAIAAGDVAVGEFLPAEAPEWALADLNTALFAGGLHARVEKDVTVPGLVHVVHVATGGDVPSLVAPRHRIDLAPGARMNLVETYAGLDAGPVFTDTVTEVDLAAGARLRRVKIQREPLTATHVGLCSARIGRDATLEDVSFSLGAGISRHDIHASLSGTGAHTTLNGVFLGRGDQHVDHRTTIEHVETDGTSRQSYRGIVDDAAHGVFTGKIIVRPGAQRTDADQQNKNLILSTKALVDSTPQLEIHADDVKCAHGSTIGQLDEAQLFYLRTRGIPVWDARLMLTEVFAREPLAVVAEDGLRGLLEGLVTDWFIAGHPDADPAKGHSPATTDPLRAATAIGPRRGTRKTA